MLTGIDHADFLRGATVARALDTFDSLSPIQTDFMLGRWFGWEIKTGHPLEGLLDALGWYGKAFDSIDEVQPLLVKGANGDIFPVAPTPFILRVSYQLPLVKAPFMRPANRLFAKLLRTRHTQARLRLVAFRGQPSATMIYDHVPIHDHFRMVDERTVLGIMDYKQVPQPYFFMLQREASPATRA